MTSAGDKGSRTSQLSPISQQMQALRDAVLEEWLRRVRAAIPAAKDLGEPVLIDTFPSLYDNLTQALSPAYPRTSAAAATPAVALEHGGERARLTAYEAESIIIEYQILRSTILDILKQHKVPVSEDEAQVIGSAIDASLREAVTAFALAQSAFREQFFAALAHDLRSPLSNASISAELICRTSDIGKIHHHARKIGDNIGRVDQMIQELLDSLLFQHGTRLRITPANFDIGEVVTEVCELMTNVHGTRCEVRGGAGTRLVGARRAQASAGKSREQCAQVRCARQDGVRHV